MLPLILLIPISISGQGPCPPPRPGLPVPFCRLDGSSTGNEVFEAPRYPPVMRQAGIGGSARVSLIVDTTGRVVLRSVRPVDGSNRAFYHPTEQAVLNHRFAPPTIDGKRVDAVLEVEIEYLAGPDSIPSRYVLSTSRNQPGYRVRVGWQAIPRGDAPAGVTRNDSLAAVLAVLEHQVQPADSAGRALCVSLRWEDPPEDVLAAVRRIRPLTFPRSRCPPTYATWVLTPGTRPRPAGALDPDHFDLTSITLWTPDLLVVGVREGRGISGIGYVCDVIRAPHASGWQLDRCRSMVQWVS